jgi:hypothetical protein
MIRAESLKKLTHEIIIKELEINLVPAGFKYIKGNNSFKRGKGIYDQVLFIGLPHNALEFNSDKEELLLNFSIHAYINIPKLDKWAMEKISHRSHFHHAVQSFEGVVEIDFTKLNKDDFFTPTESRLFKNAVTTALIGPQDKKRRHLNEIKTEIPELLISLEKASDALYLLENRPAAYWNYLLLLVFTQHTDLARQNFENSYHEIIRTVKENLNSNNQNTKQEVQALEDFIADAKTLLNLEFANPYKRDVQVKEKQETKVRLSNSLGYEEVLRLDLSMIDLRSHAINDKGELLFLLDKYRIMKINSDGKVIGTWEFGYPKCFRELYNVDVKWDNASKSFFVNNMVITEANTILELKIDIDTENEKKGTIYPNVRDLVFDRENGLFLLLFSFGKNTILTSYNQQGELIYTLKIKGDAAKINLKAKQVFIAGAGNSYDLFTFEGEFVRNLEYNNGNRKIEISPDGNMILLHFYSTKSQLYNIANNSEKVLWAHPTYLKEYKELFYNDINHNFGLTTACFTPDGKYIVGGADHGKYVTWDTEKFNRKELIPNIESMSIFNWFTTTYSYEDGKATNNYFTPYTVEHEGHTLFINRGYDMSNVFFIDSGKHIVTQNGDSLLTWNDAFENTGFVDSIGRVTFSPQNYMATQSDNEFILFRRVNEPDANFQSSQFRKKSSPKNKFTDEDLEQTPPLEIENNAKEIIKETPKPPRNGFFKWLFGK